MSFSTDWDIEKYRVGYESEEHWELRKKFLVKHKNKYPEDTLICLAQVFYNVEFLGCRYPKATMKIVETLSKGIVEDHREKMKGRLKRTFVEASDAASSKAKGLKHSATAAKIDDKSTSSTILSYGPTSENPTPPKFIKFEPTAQVSVDNNVTDEPASAKKKRKKKKKKSGPSNTSSNPLPSDLSESPNSFMPSIPKSKSFEDLILYFREHDNARGKLQSFCNFNKIPYQLSTEPQERSAKHNSCVKIFGVVVGSGTGSTALLAQQAAARSAIALLSKQCYTILVMDPFVVERKVERHEIIDGLPIKSSETEIVQDDKASRMMKMMGWTGGGLGKEEQGRTEPIIAVSQTRRAGVGSTVGRIKLDKLKNILQQFIRNGSTHDVIFSSDFTSEERKEIHTFAHQFGLKTVSRATGADRFLTISRKWKPQTLLAVLKDANNQSAKFKLVPPNTEAVASERQRHRTEETHLQDLEKDAAEIVSQEKRARADEAVGCHQYERQLQELKAEIDTGKQCEVAAIGEINLKVLAALRNLVTQEEHELAELRWEKQRKTENFCFSADVHLDITSRISSDLKLVSKKVEEAKKEMKKLNAKRAVAQSIVNKIRAHTEGEKNAKLELECLFKAMCIERRNRNQIALIESKQARVRLRQFATSQNQTPRSAILRELEEETLRGGNLTKELCELMQLTTKKAARREEWLKRQFPTDEKTAT